MNPRQTRVNEMLRQLNGLVAELSEWDGDDVDDVQQQSLAIAKESAQLMSLCLATFSCRDDAGIDWNEKIVALGRAVNRAYAGDDSFSNMTELAVLVRDLCDCRHARAALVFWTHEPTDEPDAGELRRRGIALAAKLERVDPPPGVAVATNTLATRNSTTLANPGHYVLCLDCGALKRGDCDPSTWDRPLLVEQLRRLIDRVRSLAEGAN